MKGEMRDYVVSYICDVDDFSDLHHIHFVTVHPVNSVGFWEDFYDSVFDFFESYGIDLRIVEIEEGF